MSCSATARNVRSWCSVSVLSSATVSAIPESRSTIGQVTGQRVQRIEALLDPGTFVELDQVARAPGDEAVVGQGMVDGRYVAVYSLEPATVGEVAAAKIVKAQELALRCRVPILGVVGPPSPGPPRNRGAPPASGSPGVR